MDRRAVARCMKALGRGVALTIRALWILCGVAIVAGWATLIVLGQTVWDDEVDPKSTTPKPSVSPSTPIAWTWQGRACSDGWPSTAIGKRGACSHHGGVVDVWMADDGTVARCGVGSPPGTVELMEEQLAEFGRVLCRPHSVVGTPTYP